MPDILGQSSDTTRPRLRNSLPASYPKQFGEIAAERGIAAERVPEGTALTPADLDSAERRVAAGDAAAGPGNLLERVRAQLAPGSDGYADLERVAERLLMSGRTLKRKLQERGTTFRALLDDARFRQAQHLLENPDLDIQQVAAALGYRDPACFTRAFRRWSGRTPSQARAERKAIV